MTVSRKKEMCGDLHSIQIHVHQKCLIINTTYRVEDNILYEFKDYKKFLHYCSMFVVDKDVKRIEEHIEINSEKVKKYMEIDKSENQLSLF